MDDTCVFCRMVAGLIPCHTVTEDDDILVFMDHRPLNPGHLLVIPKHHEPDFHRLDNDLYLSIMQTSKRLAQVLGTLFKPPKVGQFIIGFHVPHVHVHVVPLYHIDDFTTEAFQQALRTQPDPDLLLETHQCIRQALQALPT